MAQDLGTQVRNWCSMRLTEVCSSSRFESPRFFLGSLSFLDIELDVETLKGSLLPELLPYLDDLEEDMVQNRLR